MTSWLPLAAVLEVQPPVAVQVVAAVEDHVSVEEPPAATLLGLAVTTTLGFGTTVTVAAPLDVPPAPVQLIVKTVVALMPETSWLPLVVVLLVQLPEARHEVALLELHISVAAPPARMLAGFAVTTTTGATGASTAIVAEAEFEPPVPVQVSV